jgi:hypothetical protein
MKFTRWLYLPALLLLLSGCASTKGYLVDRGRDALDIATVGVGVGWGAKMRAGPIQSGLLFEGTCAALRGGEFTHIGKNIPPELEGWGNSTDGQWLLYGVEFFHGASLPRNKNFYASNLKSMNSDYDEDEGGFGMPFFHTLTDDSPPAPTYYTQFEAVAALGISVRLGFNPGELMDFLLGWVKVDVYKDDLEAKKRIEQSVPGYPPQGVGSPEP